MARKGRFITLEGGEGVGKSTLATGLLRQLTERGRDVLLTREPGGSSGAEELRRLILHPPADVMTWQPLTEALLFYAARTDHLFKKILPHMKVDGWVICDRFSDSTRAYQAAGSGLPSETVEELERVCVGEWGRPDLTLILDLPGVLASARVSGRGAALDAIEARGPEYHERVRQAFLDIADRFPERCVVIDAGQSPDAVLEDAMMAIHDRLGARTR